MSPEIIEAHEKLKTEVSRLAHAYYVLGSSLVPDDVYDSLFRRLQDMEMEHSSLNKTDSPTIRVGGEPLPFLESVTHNTPMLSLSNALNEGEMIAKVSGIAKTLGVPDDSLSLVIEPKYDGLALCLTYVKGLLTKAATRGNGETGEDVTAQARTIKTIPLRLAKPVTVEVRGEALILKESFEKVNDRLIAAGDRPYKNTRNAASGILRQLDSRITAQRPLTFFAYSALGLELSDVENAQDSELRELQRLGFLVSSHVDLVTGIDGVKDYFSTMSAYRKSLPFDIDGVVIKLNSFDHQDQMGWTSTTPNWAFAYKFPAEETTTVLEHIDVQVGRTGKLTPVARITPVFVGGVTVSNVTLHNENIVNTVKDVRVGDSIVVRRAGDVIPEIAGPILELRAADAVKWFMPKCCPTCGSPTHFLKGDSADEVGAHYCLAGTGCPDQRLFRITHYASRIGMEIENLGEKSVAQLVSEGLITCISDLYSMDMAKLASLRGWSNHSASQLHTALHVSSVGRPLRRFLVALGIEGVGEGTAKRLALHFGSWDELRKATRESLLAIKDIGPTTADSIMLAFSNEETVRELDLLASWAKPAEEKRVAGGPLTGMTVVVTGTLPTLDRKAAKLMVEALGGKTSDSVSKKTSYVIAGAEAGSKLATAERMGVPVVDESWLLSMNDDMVEVESQINVEADQPLVDATDTSSVKTPTKMTTLDEIQQATLGLFD